MKKLPELKTDNDAEDFIDTADLTEYDLSVLMPMKFEFQKKNAVLLYVYPTRCSKPSNKKRPAQTCHINALFARHWKMRCIRAFNISQ